MINATDDSLPRTATALGARWPQLMYLPEDAATFTSVVDASTATHSRPFVRDDGPTISLHFSLDELQSCMNKLQPQWLEVDYTRTMMGFLLFNPAPVHITMIGLGGGSLAKFCYSQLPRSRMTVLEINPEVIALRKTFCVPDDDARFEVIEADGAVYVATQTETCDVLLVDGFDEKGQPPALCSQGFYDDCFNALTPGGVLAVNLHYEDAAYPLWLARLQRSFGGHITEIPALEKSNCIVFASRAMAMPAPRQISVQAALSGLDASARQQLKAEFARITWTMRDASPD